MYGNQSRTPESSAEWPTMQITSHNGKNVALWHLAAAAHRCKAGMLPVEYLSNRCGTARNELKVHAPNAVEGASPCLAVPEASPCGPTVTD